MNLKQKLAALKKSDNKIHYNDFPSHVKLIKNIESLLPDSDDLTIVVVCIGTDRSTGDSLGPLIGTKLIELNEHQYPVYGTLEQPIHAINLDEKLKEINHAYRKPFIIAIDACLGKYNNIGTISIGEGPVLPGAGVNKKLSPVGDMHITGIVNVSGYMEYFVLQNTRLSLVMNMAKVISECLHLAISRHINKYTKSVHFKGHLPIKKHEDKRTPS
ncbi:putative sporulation protein YyaC [Scopulibacillus daqui]|uniref:Sporulation protein YyaC n=1 Tax=Scopulibacillus daqui TaxID=1469162 RepID=A0ABS2PZY0_9BACL|nr:spore protease YyaC [Scopulibacillus daqui]MBM7645521.1 putative sporulation protein YyaC [Scopulibacillus daqui]